MRSIWQIYKTDWVNIFKVPTGVFLILAIILLPCLYDWVNIKSVWDPYANTSGVKVAVTNEDQGATVLDKQVNIGDELVKSLRQNPKLGWTFVDREEAERGVDKGTYYASILVPADFSARITGIAEGRLDRPEVVYTVNEKVNAIAPKITSSGVSSITKQINENFTEAVSEALLTKLEEVGVQVEEQLPTIRKIENGIFELESKLPEIRAAGQKVLEIEQKLPEIHAKAQIIPEVEQRIPEIEQAAGYLLQIQQNWPKISEAASEVLVIQSKLPEIKQAAAKVQELDSNFDKVADAISLASDKTAKAMEIVAAAQDALPRIAEIADKGAAFADQLNEFLASNDGAFSAIAPVIKQNLALAQQAADTIALLSDKLLNADPDTWPTADEIYGARDKLTAVAGALDRTSSLLGRINAYLPGSPLTGTIERIDNAANRMHRQSEILGEIGSALEKGKAPARQMVQQLNQLAKQTSEDLGSILSRYDSEIVPAIAQGIQKLKTTAGAAADKLQAAKSKLPDVEAILADTRAGLEFGQAELGKIQGQLPEIRAKVHELAVSFQSKAEAFEKAINTAAPFVKNDLPAIGKKLDEAAAFGKNDLPEAERELSKLADFVRNKLPEVENGVHKVAGLVRNDLPQLESAVRQAADKLRAVEENNHFAELAKLLRGDIRKESEFLSAPVQIKENRKYPIPNYGSAMSPFYGVLSLWVGATLLISLLKPDPNNEENRYKPYQLYLGRLGTFATIGMCQALAITLGDFFILDTYVADKLEFVLFAMLVSLVFVTITYTLLSVFGNVGKGIAIIFMVFQFSSSGGTFPISTASPFFQALNPFMPFTYAISLLREAVGGILWSTALRDIAFLIGFIALSLVLALALKRPLSGVIRKSTENAKKTKIIA
ncbi:YhgE/Pip domain-containing protein [Cohnella terricola]|uniref:YhgE/Pip domain-containing protein n=1 Tax=Cohnella terricola TaxID=1289167 RepID=A0A559JIQ1_9BACL|nr:YhgE/Pip domain-containing protein [Cohnella terricola]TVX99755.1 YhgE/Pip domain-containing protein [Cohnella terricola]